MLTFHRILSACETGSPDAWKVFVQEYSPIAHSLCLIYFPFSLEKCKDLWRDVISRLRNRECEQFRALDHQAEREFLVDLRALLLQLGRALQVPSENVMSGAQPTTQSIQALLKDLPLLHQQILFMKLAGYSNGTLEKILMISPQVAKPALERLRPDHSAVLEQQEDRCLWPAAWSAVLSNAQASRSENCPSLRQFVRILDGQATWYDKVPVEQHMSQCLYCLERWTSLREVVFWRREAPPLPPAEAENLLAELSIGEPVRRRTSLLKMLFD